MNREIKFRGKDASGEWKHGSLIQKEEVTSKGVIMVSFIAEGLPVGTSDFVHWDVKLSRVIPDTVGQFTGLKDKNGIEIYEGDVVRYKTYQRGKPKYITGKIVIHKCCYELRPTDGTEVTYFLSGYSESDSHRFEVIGNITDEMNNKK